MPKLSEFKLDPRNANRHSEYGTGLLENSLRDLGAGRSVLATSDNVIIAGNGVAEASQAIGMERVKIVDTDGKDLIVVRRTDLKYNSPQAMKMALADNIVAQKNIVLDTDIVESIVTDFPETKFWADIVTEDKTGKVDKDRADSVEMKFQLSSKQYAKVKTAMKAAKQKFKEQFSPNENENEQGNCLYFMALEFLKNNK